MARRIAFLIFPDFQLLDATGPIVAFETAQRSRPDFYDWTLVAAQPGPVTSTAGVTLEAAPFSAPSTVDSLVVVGGFGVQRASQSSDTLDFVRACAKRARRVVSICAGAYILATAGLLDGRSATTHWGHTAEFARRFPNVRLESDRIFIKQGNVWTSAGNSAGIDLALALIGEGLGEEIARRTVQQRGGGRRRPGGRARGAPRGRGGRVE